MMEIPKNYTLYEKSSTTTNPPLFLMEKKGKTEDNDEFGFKVTKNEEGDNVTKYYKYQNNGQSKQEKEIGIAFMRDGSKVKLDTVINTKGLELDKEPTKVLDIGEIDRFGHFNKNSNFDLSHTGYEKQIIRLVGELKRYRLNKEEQEYLNQIETYANILTKNCGDIYEYLLKI